MVLKKYVGVSLLCKNGWVIMEKKSTRCQVMDAPREAAPAVLKEQI